MNSPVELQSARVAILGLGLMGGSLALALREHCAEVLGFDPDPVVISQAQKLGLCKQVSSDLKQIVPQADMLILAAPVRKILSLIQQLDELHPGNPVVLDIGSTKAQICRALATLPERFDPVGGHPMCGKAVGGLVHAEASLFQGATFALTALNRSTTRATHMAESLVEAVKAIPFWVDPGVHDYWTAATSHLPYLLSLALTQATPEEVTPLIGPGFRSSSRLAGSSVAMMTDILATNRENLLEAAARFRTQLDGLERAIALQDWESLVHLMEQGQAHHSRLVG